MTIVGRSGMAGLAVLVISTGLSGVSSALAASGGAWSPAASMRQPHQAATATLLANGKVLVVGSFGHADAGAELYDPVADIWPPTARPAVARRAGRASLRSS